MTGVSSLNLARCAIGARAFSFFPISRAPSHAILSECGRISASLLRAFLVRRTILLQLRTRSPTAPSFLPRRGPKALAPIVGVPRRPRRKSASQSKIPPRRRGGRGVGIVARRAVPDQGVPDHAASAKPPGTVTSPRPPRWNLACLPGLAGDGAHSQATPASGQSGEGRFGLHRRRPRALPQASGGAGLKPATGGSVP